MSAALTSDWIVPTVRSTSWGPLAGLAGCLGAATAVAAYAETWPEEQLGIVAAALAAALVAGLKDPAAALLAALPTSATRRRARRQALLIPAGLALWLAYVGLGRTWQPDAGWHLDMIVALTATAFAVEAWAPPRIAVESGVAAPVAWYAGSWAGGAALDPDLAEVIFAWKHHSLLVTIAAVAAIGLKGRSR